MPDRSVVGFGAQHSIGRRFLPQWPQALDKGYGPILSRLRADDLPNCPDDLRNGEVDFVVAHPGTEPDRPGHGGVRDFDNVTIGGDRLFPVCKPNADGTPLLSLEDARAEMPCLRRPRPAGAPEPGYRAGRPGSAIRARTPL